LIIRVGGGSADEVVRQENATFVGKVSRNLGDEEASLEGEVDLGDKNLESMSMENTKNTGKEKVQESNGTQESSDLTIQEKSGQEAKGEHLVCQRCREEGHLAADCNKNWQPNRGEYPVHLVNRDRNLNLSELIAPLCATQAEGQAFLCIPDRPLESNARERVNTVIITVIKGTVTSKQLEDEFTRIMPKLWRWTARKVAENRFTVRFPNAVLIQEWGCFNPISMRVAKAKINIDPWNGSVGAKAELQYVWFRVRGCLMIKEVWLLLLMLDPWLGLLMRWTSQHCQGLIMLGLKLWLEMLARCLQ
jgi:hypothetical protein